MARAAPLIDEIANELDTWPGVGIEPRADGTALVRYEDLELGILDRDRGLAGIRLAPAEYRELVERGAAEPDASTSTPDLASQRVEGPADVTAALDLFDRRYRELRGEGEPYSSEDPKG
jgi:hypothetical protein